jgi:hypothetical protein
VTTAYALMSTGERAIDLLAAAVAMACLAIVVTTPLGRIHTVAVPLGPSMAVVVGLVARRAIRRRDGKRRALPTARSEG